MRRYDAVMGCCLALLLMATAVTSYLYLVWLSFAAEPTTLMALPGFLLASLWVLFLWVARRRHSPPDAPTT